MERKRELTKILLAESFKELLIKGSFDKITIKMITDQAGVIRPCRYLFFQADTETIAKYGKTVPREFPGYSRDISTGRTGNRRNLHRKKS